MRIAIACASALLMNAAAVSAHVRTASGMVRIPAGSYMPLYADAGRISVKAFRLDAYPVSQTQLNAGRTASARAMKRPATRVTLAQARAYCVAQGKRLPTIHEWEYVAAASRTARDGTADAAFRQELLDLYMRARARDPRIGSTFRNVYGVHDLHGLVWEWTEAAHDHAHHKGATHDMSCAGSAVGASSTADFAAFMRYAFRAGLTPTSAHENLGFRCAAGAA